MKHLGILGTCVLLLLSCTADRDLPDDTVITDPDAVLVHYWNFNALPGGTLSEVPADVSLIPNSAKITYEGSGAGYLDSFTPGYTTNAHQSDLEGAGLRARNPSIDRSLLLKLPTTGFKKPVVRFATARSGSGATQQMYSYSTDGEHFVVADLATLTYNAPEDPLNELVTLDFSNIVAADDNPNFRIRIAFGGQNADGTTGNNRFDNITLEAIPLSAGQAPSNLSYSTDNIFTVNSAITPLSPTVTGIAVNYSITPALPDGLVLDAATGTISGTPTAATPLTTHTVTAVNAFGNTTANLTITVHPQPVAVLIHYWNFNALPTGTLTAIAPDQSLLATNLSSISYPGSGAGYMDQVNPGSVINARNNDAEGLGLRVRNPSDTRQLLVKAPTTGYQNIVLAFATERSNSGATEQQYSYSLDGSNFVTSGLPLTTYSPAADPNYEIVTLDFSGIPGVANNPNFVFRISFGGASASGASGNNRFDNLTLEGTSL